MRRGTLFEAFNMQGRHIHPVALSCFSIVCSKPFVLCSYWWTFPRFLCLCTSQACSLTLQSIWFSPWSEPGQALWLVSKAVTFTSVQVIGYVPHQHFYNTCHISFTTHVSFYWEVPSQWPQGHIGTIASRVCGDKITDIFHEVQGHLQPCLCQPKLVV